MKRMIGGFGILFFLLGVLASCAPVMEPPLAPLQMGSARTAGAQYVPKVDNFEVILDSSYSLSEGKDYYLQARQIASRINQGVPTDLDYTAGLRSFGHSTYQSDAPTELLYGLSSYNRNDFHNALNKIQYVGGTSPLAAALTAAGNDLQGKSGKSAVVVISDGLHMDDAPAAAVELKKKLGSDVCIYTIAVGKDINGMGQELLEKVAQAGQCGSATNAAALSSESAMNSYIDRVFLAQAPPPPPKPVVVPKPVPVPVPPADSDGDGVTDDRDRCPATPKGQMVDENGCTLQLTLHINFDTDSAEIKPEFQPELAKAAAYVTKYKQVPYILLAGHTDNRGTPEYNQDLSERRAKAVREELIKTYGIAAERLFAKGYGLTQPVADNATAEGRYDNRRVEVICCAVKPE